MNNLLMRLPVIAAIAIVTFGAGCSTSSEQSQMSSQTSATPAPAPAVTPAPAAAPAPAETATAAKAPAEIKFPVRIKAGVFAPLKDAEGNVWLADQGFADGDTVDRDETLEIANTKTPSLYRTERYSMTSFSYPLPNGKYNVKLHFAETFEGISGPGDRVFSFNVEGHEFKDFDVWVKAGGPQRAYIETVPVEITDGKLDIKFEPKNENPEINAIEIWPAS